MSPILMICITVCLSGWKDSHHLHTCSIIHSLHPSAALGAAKQFESLANALLWGIAHPVFACKPSIWEALFTPFSSGHILSLWFCSLGCHLGFLRITVWMLLKMSKHYESPSTSQAEEGLSAGRWGPGQWWLNLLLYPVFIHISPLSKCALWVCPPGLPHHLPLVWNSSFSLAVYMVESFTAVGHILMLLSPWEFFLLP